MIRFVFQLTVPSVSYPSAVVSFRRPFPSRPTAKMS